jgi:hypothetical protein
MFFIKAINIGKSMLIKLMIARLYRIYKENSKKLIVIALTGLAAYHISSITLYN